MQISLEISRPKNTMFMKEGINSREELRRCKND